MIPRVSPPQGGSWLKYPQGTYAGVPPPQGPGDASLTYAAQVWVKDALITPASPTVRGFVAQNDYASADKPAGIAVAATGGAITGTPTVEAYNGTFHVTVTGTNGVVYTATVSYSTAVAPDLSVPASPVIAEENIAVTPITVTNSGGTTGVVYSISAGSLPSGWSINPANGTVSGTHIGSVVASTTYTVLATGPTGLTDSVVVTYQVDAQVPAFSYVGSPFDLSSLETFDNAPTRTDTGTLPLTYDVTVGTLRAYETLDPDTGHVAGQRPL